MIRFDGCNSDGSVPEMPFDAARELASIMKRHATLNGAPVMFARAADGSQFVDSEGGLADAANAIMDLRSGPLHRWLCSRTTSQFERRTLVDRILDELKDAGIR